MFHWADADHGHGWTLALSPDGFLEFATKWPGGWEGNLRSRSPIPLNAWMHAGVTVGRHELRLFIDGAPQGSIRLPSADHPTGTDSMIDVGWIPGQPERFEGRLDEIGFWARALRADEVNALYRKRIEGPCKP